ncbi:SGNH/GDSL hydrolase family protein [Mycoplasma buteonis]|uniref:SGNH/GDSL hydrolase family protein n=1 Tax=Mycoplasma buteonis TaxID=171280 RepID=UPI0005698C5C|nr:SGNH/GDSL hydrolase family protein [Mycoplasma buteonis]
MKNKSNLALTILGAIGTAVVATSCAAPGSSKEIQTGDAGIDPNFDKDKAVTEKLPTNKVTSEIPQNSQDNNSNNDLVVKPLVKKKSDKFIDTDQKVNYVAFGDSMTAGFDGSLPADYPGEFKNNEVTGASYPAFLAKILNKEKKLASFENYAISGATALDWIEFLQINSDFEKQDVNVLNNLFNLKNIPVAQIKNDLANANLITFTLGANDFFYLIFQGLQKSNLFQLIETLNSDDPSYSQIAVLASKIYQEAIPEVKSRLATLISNLKVLAPKANINLISYPTPFLGLKQVLDNAFKNLVGDSLKLNISDEIIGILNDNLQEVANKYDINYVNLYNPEYWNKNNKKLSSIFIDIHPNTVAYKKMAMDLYLKLSKSTFDLDKYGFYDFNQNYLTSDAKTIAYQLAPQYQDQYILGRNTDDYLADKSQFEQDLDILRSPNNYSVRLTEFIEIFKHIPLQVIKFALQNPLYTQLDPEHKLQKYLFEGPESDAIVKDFVDRLIDTNVFQEIINSIQSNLQEQQDKANLTLQNVVKAFKAAVFKPQFLFQIINGLAKSKLINEDKEAIIQIIDDILVNALKIYSPKIVDLAVNQLSDFVTSKTELTKEELETLLQDLFKIENNEFVNLDVKKLANAFASAFVNKSKSFENVTNATEFINALILSDEPESESQLDLTFITQIAESVQSFASTLLQNPKVRNNIIALITKALISKKIISQEHQNKANHLITRLFDELTNVNEGKLLKELTNNLVKEFFTLLPSGDLNDLTTLAGQAVKNVLIDFFKNKENTINLIKVFSRGITNEQTQDQINDNKEIIKEIVNSLLSNSDINLSLIITAALDEGSQKFIDEYLGMDNFSKILSELTSNPNVAQLVNKVVTQVIDKIDLIATEAENINELQDLAKIILTKLDINDLKTQLNNLIDSLLANDNFKDALAKIIDNYLNTLNLEIESQSQSNLAKDIANDLGSILHQLDLWQPSLDILYNAFEQAKSKNSTDEYLAVFKAIPNQILELLKEKYQDNYLELIKNIISRPLFQNNQQVWAKVLTKLFVKLAHSNYIEELLVTNLRPELEKLQIYVDADEIEAIVKEFIRSDEFISVGEKFISSLLSDTNWTSDLANKSIIDVFTYFWNKTKFKNDLLNEIKPFIKRVINEQNFKNSLLKVLDYAAKKNEFNLDLEHYQAQAEFILATSLAKLQSTGFLNNLIDTIFARLQAAEDLTQIPSELLTEVSNWAKGLDFNDLANNLVISASSLNEEQQDKLADYLGFLVEQVTKYKDFETWINYIDLSNTFIGDQNQAVKNLILATLKDEEFVKLTKKTIKYLINNKVEFNFALLSDIVLNALKNENYFLGIKDSLVKLINSHLISEQNIDLISNLTIKYLATNSLANQLFDKISIDSQVKLLSNILKSNWSLIQQLDLVNLITVAVAEFSKDSQANNWSDLLNKITDKIKEKVATLDINKLVIQSLNNLFNSKENLNDTDWDAIKQLLNNAITFFDNNEEQVTLLLTKLPSEIHDKINEILSDSQLLELVKFVLKNNDFKALFDKLIANAINNVKTENSINLNSYFDLVKLLFKNFDWSTNQEQIKNLITNLLDNQNIKDILANTLNKLVKTQFSDFATQNANELEKFTGDIAKNINTLLNELNLKDVLINALTSYLDKIFQQNSFSDTIEDFAAHLLTKVKAVYLNSNNELNKAKLMSDFKILLKSPIVNDNLPLIKNFIKYLISQENVQNWLKTAIATSMNQLYEANSEIQKWVDKDEFSNLATVIFDSKNLTNLTSSLINHLIDNFELLKTAIESDSPDYAQLSFDLVKANNYTKNNSQLISGAILELIKNKKLDKSLNKIINKILKDKNLIESDLPEEFASSARQSLIAVLTSNSSNLMLNQLLNIFNEALGDEQVNNWAQLLEKITPKLINVFDFKDYKNIKLLLNLPIWNEQNKDILTQIVKNIFKNYLTTEKVNNLIDAQDFTAVINKLGAVGLTEEKLKDFIKKQYANQDLQNIIKESINIFVTQLTTENNLLAAANSYNDLTKVVFSNQDFVVKIRDYFNKLVSDIIGDSEFQNQIATKLTEIFKDPAYNQFFNGIESVELEKLAKNIIGLYNEINPVLNLSQTVFDALINQLQNNGYQLEITSITSSVAQALKNGLNLTSDNSKIIELIKVFAKSNLFEQNKATILTILDNVYKLIDTPENAAKLLNTLSQSVKEQITKFISWDKFNSFASEVIGSQEFKNVFLATAKSIINHSQEYQDIENLNDVIKITLKNLDFTQLKDSLLKLVNLIIKNHNSEQIIKSALETTLQTYQVNTSEDKVQNFLNDLSHDLTGFISNLDFLTEIVESIFNQIKEAQENDSDLLSVFSKIPATVKTIIENHYGNNLLNFINQIYQLPAIQNHKEALKQVLIELIKGLYNTKTEQSNQLLDWIKAPINKINSKVFDLNTKELLTNFINEVLAKDDVYNVLDPLLTRALEEQNLDYLGKMSQPFAFAKYLINNEKLITSLKPKLKETILKLADTTTYQSVSPFVTNIIFNVLKIYHLDEELNTITDKELLIKDVLKNLATLLNNTNIYELVYDAITESISQANDETEFTSLLATKVIKNLDLANNYSIVKELIKASTSVTQHKENWIEFSNHLVHNFLNNNEHRQSLINKIDLSLLAAKLGLESNQITQLIDKILVLPEFETLFNDSINHFFTNASDLVSPNSYDELIKAFVQNSEFQNKIVEDILRLIDQVTNDSSITNLIAKILYTQIKASNFSFLLNDISEENALAMLSDGYGILKQLDSQIPFINDALTTLIKQVAANGKNIDFTAITSQITEKFSEFFKNKNIKQIEKDIFSLIKVMLAEDGKLNQHKATVKTLLHNLVNYFVHNYDFGQIIWDAIPSASQQFILDNFVDNTSDNGQNTFVNIVNDFIRVNYLSNIINHFSDYLLDQSNDWKAATNLRELLAKYLKDTVRQNDFKANFKQFILGAVKSDSFKTNTKYVINKFFKFLGVNITSEISDYINVLVEGLGKGIDDLGILDNLIQTLINLINQPEMTIEELTNYLKNNLISSLKLTDYATFKKFLTNDLIINHKTVVKRILLDIISKFLTQKDKLTKIIHDLNIARALLGEADEESYNSVNLALVEALNNTKLNRILEIVIEDILSRNNEYLKQNSWYGALNVLLNKPKDSSVDALKTNLQGWITDVLNSSNSFYHGIARVMIAKMNNSGMKLSITKDEELFTKVIEGAFKAVASSKQFKTIFDNIYSNLAKTDFTKVSDPAAKFNSAMIDGVKSIIMVDNSKTEISLDKLLNQQDLLKAIIEKIGYKNYVQFINRLFEASTFKYISTNNGNSGHIVEEETTGIYKLFISFIKQDTSNTSVKFDVNIFNVVSKAESFFKIFFKPIYQELFRKITNNEYSRQYLTTYKMTDEYRALFRIYTTLLWAIGSSLGYNSSKFWNSFGIDAQAIINRGASAAFDEARNATPKFNEFLGTWKKVMGATYRGWYNDEFIQGNRSASTYNSNYWADQLLAYVYYMKNTKDRHSNKTKADVLLNALKNGWLKSPQ